MTAERRVCWFGMLLSLCFSSQSWAFPGPGYSLLQNWSEASLVVAAKVESVKFEDTQEVVLSVSSFLKAESEANLDTLQIFTHGAFFGCSSPYLFKEGKLMIIFLKLDAGARKYTPVSYDGCIEVDHQGREHFSAALKQLPAILSQSNPKLRNERLLDWYVRLAAEPVTRAEGSWGIANFQRSQSLNRLITPDHYQRLLKALLTEQPPARNASELARVLLDYPSPELDTYLLESLRRSHELGWEDVARMSAQELPARLGIEPSASTRARLKEWEHLAHRVQIDLYVEYDPTKSDAATHPYILEKQRLNILWGAITSEIHAQCWQAMKERE